MSSAERSPSVASVGSTGNSSAGQSSARRKRYAREQLSTATTRAKGKYHLMASDSGESVSPRKKDGSSTTPRASANAKESPRVRQFFKTLSIDTSASRAASARSPAVSPSGASTGSSKKTPLRSPFTSKSNADPSLDEENRNMVVSPISETAPSPHASTLTCVERFIDILHEKQNLLRQLQEEGEASLAETNTEDSTVVAGSRSTPSQPVVTSRRRSSAASPMNPSLRSPASVRNPHCGDEDNATTITSVSALESMLDNETLERISMFIDAMQEKGGASQDSSSSSMDESPVPSPPHRAVGINKDDASTTSSKLQDTLTRVQHFVDGASDQQRQKILEAVESGSGDEQDFVDPVTLSAVGNFIDALAKCEKGGENNRISSHKMGASPRNRRDALLGVGTASVPVPQRKQLKSGELSLDGSLDGPKSPASSTISPIANRAVTASERLGVSSFGNKASLEPTVDLSVSTASLNNKISLLVGDDETSGVDVTEDRNGKVMGPPVMSTVFRSASSPKVPTPTKERLKVMGPPVFRKNRGQISKTYSSGEHHSKVAAQPSFDEIPDQTASTENHTLMVMGPPVLKKLSSQPSPEVASSSKVSPKVTPKMTSKERSKKLISPPILKKLPIQMSSNVPAQPKEETGRAASEEKSEEKLEAKECTKGAVLEKIPPQMPSNASAKSKEEIGKAAYEEKEEPTTGMEECEQGEIGKELSQDETYSAADVASSYSYSVSPASSSSPSASSPSHASSFASAPSYYSASSSSTEDYDARFTAPQSFEFDEAALTSFDGVPPPSYDKASFDQDLGQPWSEDSIKDHEVRMASRPPSFDEAPPPSVAEIPGQMATKNSTKEPAVKATASISFGEAPPPTVAAEIPGQTDIDEVPRQTSSNGSAEELDGKLIGPPVLRKKFVLSPEEASDREAYEEEMESTPSSEENPDEKILPNPDTKEVSTNEQDAFNLDFIELLSTGDGVSLMDSTAGTANRSIGNEKNRAGEEREAASISTSDLNSETLAMVEAYVVSLQDEASAQAASDVPDETLAQVKNFIEKLHAKKEGRIQTESIHLEPDAVRIKRDPPLVVPANFPDDLSREEKEDPPIRPTLSHELARWIAGNGEPEMNPKKLQPEGEEGMEISSPDDDCKFSVADCSGELPKNGSMHAADFGDFPSGCNPPSPVDPFLLQMESYVGAPIEEVFSSPSARDESARHFSPRSRPSPVAVPVCDEGGAATSMQDLDVDGLEDILDGQSSAEEANLPLSPRDPDGPEDILDGRSSAEEANLPVSPRDPDGLEDILDGQSSAEESNLPVSTRDPDGLEDILVGRSSAEVRSIPISPFANHRANLKNVTSMCRANQQQDTCHRQNVAAPIVVINVGEDDAVYEHEDEPEPRANGNLKQAIDYIHNFATIPIPQEDSATLEQEKLIASSVSEEHLAGEDFEAPEDIPDGIDPLLVSEAFCLLHFSLTAYSDIPDREALISMIRFSFPYFRLKNPSAIELMDIREEADRLGLPIEVADRFIDMALAQKTTASSPKKRPSDAAETSRHEEAELLAFVGRVADLASAEVQEDPLNDNEGLAFAGSEDVDAVEVDLDGDVKDGDDDEKSVVSDVPWWEAAADFISGDQEQEIDDEDKDLYGGHYSLGNSTVSRSGEVSADEERPASVNLSSKSQSTFEQEDSPSQSDDADEADDADVEIENFWQSRRELRERRMQFANRASNTQVELPNLNTASFSNGSQTTASYSRGAHSKGGDSDDIGEEEAWARRRDMANWNPDGEWEKGQWLARRRRKQQVVDDPEPIDGVSSVGTLRHIAGRWNRRRDRALGSKWWQSYGFRTRAHPGFFDIDFYSLYDATTVCRLEHEQDMRPWEHRDVKQRFMYEHSISDCRNWFGSLQEYGGNPKIKAPVCQPKSMEMPMKAPEWTDEWYKAPTFAPLASNLSGSFDGDILQSMSKDEERAEDETSYWEETPECGVLKNVTLKPGERISRVTPHLTSSLRRSRWRKKYFPKGSFPYD